MSSFSSAAVQGPVNQPQDISGAAPREGQTKRTSISRVPLTQMVLVPIPAVCCRPPNIRRDPFPNVTRFINSSTQYVSPSGDPVERLKKRTQAVFHLPFQSTSLVSRGDGRRACSGCTQLPMVEGAQQQLYSGWRSDNMMNESIDST